MRNQRHRPLPLQRGQPIQEAWPMTCVRGLDTFQPKRNPKSMFWLTNLLDDPPLPKKSPEVCSWNFTGIGEWGSWGVVSGITELEQPYTLSTLKPQGSKTIFLREILPVSEPPQNSPQLPGHDPPGLEPKTKHPHAIRERRLHRGHRLQYW